MQIYQAGYLRAARRNGNFCMLPMILSSRACVNALSACRVACVCRFPSYLCGNPSAMPLQQSSCLTNFFGCSNGISGRTLGRALAALSRRSSQAECPRSPGKNHLRSSGRPFLFEFHSTDLECPCPNKFLHVLPQELLPSRDFQVIFLV